MRGESFGQRRQQRPEARGWRLNWGNEGQGGGRRGEGQRPGHGGPCGR